MQLFSRGNQKPEVFHWEVHLWRKVGDFTLPGVFFLESIYNPHIYIHIYTYIYIYYYIYIAWNIPHNMNICDMMFSSTLVGFTRIDFTSKRQRFCLPDWLLGPRTPRDDPFSMDWFKGKFTGNHGFYH